MQTTADDCRDEAKRLISEAASCLSRILLDEAWGYHEYTKKYTDTLAEVMHELLKLKNRL